MRKVLFILIAITMNAQAQQPDWLDTTAYPFKPHYLTIDNARLHYIDEGKGEETLLFVHGTPSWSFDYREAIKTMSATHRCIALDHIGFGLSDKPEKYPYSTFKHSENLETLIDSLHLENITLVVHDFGGPIGLNYAINHPEKIKRIVILNSWLWNTSDEPEYKKFKKILKSPMLPFLYKYFNFSAKFVLSGSFFDKSKINKQLKKQYTAPFSKPSERYGTIAFAKSLLNDQEWFGGLWEKIYVLKEKPVLFIWGMNDEVIVPRQLQKFSTAFTNKKVVELEKCGHFPQEEQSEKFIKELKLFCK